MYLRTSVVFQEGSKFTDRSEFEHFEIKKLRFTLSDLNVSKTFHTITFRTITFHKKQKILKVYTEILEHIFAMLTLFAW